MCTYKLIFIKNLKEIREWGLFTERKGLMQMGRYHFQILWTLPFQFLKDIFDETTRGPVKTLRAVADPGGGLRRLQPSFGKFSNLSGYPCLSLFHTKNNIMSYNMGFSPIDHYKKTVAIPLLDSLIIQMQDRFLTKISTPEICLVYCNRL